jgi:hypothetical protein
VRRGSNSVGLFVACLSAGCTDGAPSTPGSPDAGAAPTPDELAPTRNERRGVASTDLDISFEGRRGRARVTFEASETAGASLRAGGLQIDGVYGQDGEAIQFLTADGRLDLALPASAQEVAVTVDYQNALGGSLPVQSTFTWPYFCENLFPCHPEPSDGLRFTVELNDTPAGTTSITSASPELDAPAYMVAWATGVYTKIELGRTNAGTELAVWQRADAAMGTPAGTARLREVFQYYETVLGAYPFGSSAGSVEVDWGDGALGGMEHHPYWHVQRTSMPDPVVHAHEAAHGWFGNGVRLQCWEDLVLSEGVATYLAARALASVEPSREAGIWQGYRNTLEQAAAAPGATGVVWPDSCGEVDVIDSGLSGPLVYVKGALFLRALETTIGAATIDAALSRFFTERVGSAARFQDLLDTLEEVSGHDPNACAAAWLRQELVPASTLCP